MPGVRKRENRENQFYNVGEQGRKTGITLEDKGLRDEYGMEPVSGIFSSPEKSPPKRSAGQRRTDGTVTESESMDIQESSIPDLTPGHILRNSRTSLPPPRSRSPMKTSLGATPRRSVGPMARSSHRSSSPDNIDVGSAVNRRLDFDPEESSLQETPALSGSGARRGVARRDIYDMEESPVPGDTMQEEVTAADDESAMMQLAEEDSFAGAVEAEEPIEEANGVEESLPEDETIEEIVKQPVKRGRKRKSDALEPVAETDSQKASTRRTRGAIAQPQSAEKATKAVQPSAPKPRGRPPKAKQPTSSAEEQPSFASNAAGEPEDAAAPPQKKPRGRRPRNQTQLDEATEEAVQPEEPGPSKGSRVLAKNQPSKQGPAKAAADQSTFKKPKAAAKSKSKAPENVTNLPDLSSGRFVDAFGKPLSKDDIDHRSTTTAGSRFSRARSIFCERKAEELGTVTRTGRRNIKPIDFWRNERAAYDMQGNLIAVRHNEYQPEPRRTQSRSKGKKKKHAAVEEEEEEELEEWESNDGVLVGSYRDYDPTTETTSDEQLDAVIAWAPKGIIPVPVPNAQFKFTKLGSTGGRPFFSWGCIDMDEDDIKRSKNSRRMHMVFNIMEGAAEVTVADNVFTVHKGGVWQVPRGNNYSITNVAKKKTRIFFFQAMETQVESAE